MKKLIPSLAAACLLCSAAVAQITIVQQWNFDDLGSGLADTKSTTGTEVGFIGTVADTVLNDGAFTITRGDGFAGDTPLGQTFTTGKLTIELTLSGYNFTAAPDMYFGSRFRIDASNTTVSDLRFDGQLADTNLPPAFGDRIRLTGTAVAGVVADGVSSNSPITYGMTLDLDADTYTYWIGTPLSDGSTWVSRFNNHTGSLTISSIDAIQWAIQGSAAGYSVTLDQVKVYTGTPVPEPTTFALFAGCLALGIVVIRRRTKNG